MQHTNIKTIYVLLVTDLRTSFMILKQN